MASPNWVSAFIQFYILTNLAYLTVTHGDNKCGTQGTYTKNSVYENNLNDTLSSLVKSPKGNLFFKNNSISGQETAYAIAFCRGDSQEESCVGCVKSATNRLREDCPNQKKATGWYYSTCVLSYSNTTFEVVDDKDAVSFRTSSISNWDPVLKTLGKLFGQLRSKAATDGYNKTFYSGGMILQDSKDNIQANIQCIPDISRQKCEECLGNATNYLLTCCNGSGQVVVFYRYSCLLRYVIYLVSIDDPSTNPSAVLSPDKKSPNFIGPGIALAGAGVTLVISAIFLFIKIRRMCSKRGKRYYIIRIHHFRHNNIVGEGEEEEMFAASDDETGDMVYFRLNVIHAATSNFSVVNKLGEGGFGPVYWGKLSDGKKIAVKRLSQNSSQGLQEFKTEVKLIIKLQHKNLVRLLGCCMKRNERLLVYEYMSKSSLDKYLFDPKKAKELDWVKRVNIVSGIAKGLRYLHEDSRLKIIHRDLKASNVLLDEDMNPKISDFGTARIFGSNQIEANTDRVVGTYGYMAPEYAMEGLFSMKSDVYSFGVLLLEIISGKRNGRLFHEEHDQNLLSYAWMLWEEGQGERLIDANLNDDCPVDEALKWMRIALLCVEEDPDDRPTMSSVTCMLEGEWKTLSEPKPPVCFDQIITSDQSSSAWNVDEFGFYSSNETAQTGNSGQHKAIHYQGVQ